MGIYCRYPYKKMPVVSAFPDHIQTNSIHKHDRPASLNHENNFTRGHGNRSSIGQTPRHSSRNSFARSNTSSGGFSGSGEFSLATLRSQKNCVIRESASSLDSIRPCSHPFILMLTNSSTRGYLKWRFSTRILARFSRRHQSGITPPVAGSLRRIPGESGFLSGDFFTYPQGYWASSHRVSIRSFFRGNS